MPAATHPVTAMSPLPRARAAALLLPLPSSWPLGRLWMSSERMRSMAIAACLRGTLSTALRCALWKCAELDTGRSLS